MLGTSYRILSELYRVSVLINFFFLYLSGIQSRWARDMRQRGVLGRIQHQPSIIMIY